MSEPEALATSWRSGTCHANGIDIHYRRTDANKPPLVALHGLIGSGACLLPLAHALEKDFDLILPDARGHGGSSAPESGYLYGDLAGDILGLIEGLALPPPVLVGHSMGGMTAAVAAGTPGSMLTALILIDPTFISPAWQQEVHESDIAAEHRQLLLSTRDELITAARLRSPNRSPELIEQLVEARLRTSPSAFEVLTPPNPDWRELVRTIAVPTLLLIGGRGVVSIETARELQSLNSLLRYRLIADAGHGLPYDEPEQSSAAILAFLKEVAARDGLPRKG
ncbi:MAG: alpha/beta hydrolase [Sphingopyxis sp.]|nr:alpha/beta hydrolase [Sphingopyxis sp.]